MTTAVWPASLPWQPLRDQFTSRDRFPILETEMEDGPDRARRQSLINAKEQPVAFLFTQVQLGVFETFHWTTLSGGSSRFFMPVQMPWESTAVSRVCQIRGERPSTAPIGRLWRVSFTRVVYL